MNERKQSDLFEAFLRHAHSHASPVVVVSDGASNNAGTKNRRKVLD